MKILHVITSLAMGGAEVLVSQISPMMRDKGHEVEVAVFDGTETPLTEVLVNHGIKVHALGRPGSSVYDLRNIWRLRRLMRRFDIVHTHNTAPQLFAAIGSVLCSVMLCTTEHTTSNRRRDWKWYAAIDRWMYSRYRRVICISPQTEANLRDFVGSLNTELVTVSNGIDVERFVNADTASLGKAADGCRLALMQVAGFRPEKDQDTVIEALLLLPDYYHLYLVGDGVRRDVLQDKVARLGLESRVHFLGRRIDVPQLLKAADIVVVSSHWEGFGLVAAEGMAAGRPVIASDVDGLKQVVEGAGILFPKGDKQALANEILSLEADDDARRAVESACVERARCYDISKMVDGYLDVYNSL